MISRIRKSLTAKIFLLMSLLLLAVSGITYGAVANFLPVFYSSQLEEGLAEMSQEMADIISTHTSIEEAAGAIELFEASAQVSVVILDQKGDTVWPAYVSETAVVQEEAAEASGTSAVEEETAEASGMSAVEGEAAAASGMSAVEGEATEASGTSAVEEEAAEASGTSAVEGEAADASGMSAAEGEEADVSGTVVVEGEAADISGIAVMQEEAADISGGASNREAAEGSGPILEAAAFDEEDTQNAEGPGSSEADSSTGPENEAAWDSVVLRYIESTVEEGAIVDVMIDGSSAGYGYTGNYGGASAVKHFEIEIGGESYVMLVLGGMQPVDQAMGILKKIFPYIIGIAAVLAVLFAAAGSFYLTAPTVRLSRISRKMAVLDFTDSYQGKRTDELGILGRNLNEMAAGLSAALAGLQEANAKLRTDIEQERELERRRIAFFSAVSHELKTPVTILKGHLSGMLQGIGAYQDHERYLRRSLETTESMETMVQELLTIARMENGTLRSGKTTGEGDSLAEAGQFVRMDLSEQLREGLAELTEMAEEKALEFQVDIPDHLYVEGNPGMMQKVFRNLLVNAIRYTPSEEGNEIRVRLWSGNADDAAALFEEKCPESASVSAAIRKRMQPDTPDGGLTDPEERFVLCRVENTGVQIPEEALPHLFEAFYRAESSRSRKTGGSGLGLYIVRMALEQHKAQYAVRNTEEGVCFSFCMPGRHF